MTRKSNLRTRARCVIASGRPARVWVASARRGDVGGLAAVGDDHDDIVYGWFAAGPTVLLRPYRLGPVVARGRHGAKMP